MQQLIRKFSAVFFITVFFLGSGSGQLIHAAFHDHNYSVQTTKGSSALSVYHAYCHALQLMLPAFAKPGFIKIPCVIREQRIVFADINISIPHLYSFKTSDRAPPFLA